MIAGSLSSKEEPLPFLLRHLPSYLCHSGHARNLKVNRFPLVFFETRQYDHDALHFSLPMFGKRFTL